LNHAVVLSTLNTSTSYRLSLIQKLSDYMKTQKLLPIKTPLESFLEMCCQFRLKVLVDQEKHVKKSFLK
jgi:hypothetical protein